jgi:hypothetical protein
VRRRGVDKSPTTSAFANLVGCHDSQEPFPVFERMVLPPLVVTIDA